MILLPSLAARVRRAATHVKLEVSACLRKNRQTLGNAVVERAGRVDLAVLLFLFVPAKNPHCSFKLLVRLGVPINEVFEHLDATIAEATPLYELCANLLRSAPP
jgi:hypothetical protein